MTRCARTIRQPDTIAAGRFRSRAKRNAIMNLGVIRCNDVEHPLDLEDLEERRINSSMLSMSGVGTNPTLTANY
jgi:hypothetical protein